MSPGRDRARLRAAAREVLEAALAAADPYRLVRRHLARRRDALRIGRSWQPAPRGRIVLVAAGKAALAMARAAEDALGAALREGLAVAPTAAGRLDRVRVLAAGHPVPDERGLRAAAEVESLARGLGRDDLLLVLLSGGASALLPAPADGLRLADKAAATAHLLRSGATIRELNAVRKHLSRLKGGGLALAARPARVATLVLSDVVGDELSTIASGPTVPDPTTFADALSALARHDPGGELSAVRERLERGARGEIEETPKPGAPGFRRDVVAIVGSNRLSLEAAAGAARRLGLRPRVLTARLEGEARDVGRLLVALLREEAEARRAPICLLAGGETTVTVRGNGRGGRNQELVLAAAVGLAEMSAPAVVAALATDGVDGASEAAGGIADDRTLLRAAALGLAAPEAFLAANDSYAFFGPLGDLIVTGPTGTNVIDVMALLAGSPSSRRL